MSSPGTFFHLTLRIGGGGPGTGSPRRRPSFGAAASRIARGAVAAAALALAIGGPGTAAGADLFLADEAFVYAAVDRLNAAGLLPGFLANTRPYDLRALRAAATRAVLPADADPFDAELLRRLRAHVDPHGASRATVSAAFSSTAFLPSGGEGQVVPEGWSGRGRIFAREEKSPYASAQLRAVYTRGEDGLDDGDLLDTSLSLGGRYAALEAGKISGWYGPGRRGSLLLTNNAVPFPGVRLHDPEPIPLSGVFSFLGSVQYDFFLARMESKAVRSHSLFAGARLAARPAPWLEIGVSRLLHYGGEGRSNGIGEFFRDFFGENDPSDRSNTLGGFDVALNLPVPGQPVQLYWAPAGEFSRIAQWGNLAGIYLPRAAGIGRLDVRAEYADNHAWENKSSDWYGHPAYPHRYRGRLLGHPMGGASRDLFLEARYFIAPSFHATLSFDRLFHDPAKGAAPEYVPPGKRFDVTAAGVEGLVTRRTYVEAKGSLTRVTDPGGFPSPGHPEYAAWVALGFQADLTGGAF